MPPPIPVALPTSQQADSVMQAALAATGQHLDLSNTDEQFAAAARATALAQQLRVALDGRITMSNMLVSYVTEPLEVQRPR